MVRSGCPLNRRNYRLGLNELLGLCCKLITSNESKEYPFTTPQLEPRTITNAGLRWALKVIGGLELTLACGASCQVDKVRAILTPESDSLIRSAISAEA